MSFVQRVHEKTITNPCALHEVVSISRMLSSQNSFRNVIILDAKSVKTNESREFLNRVLSDCMIGELVDDDDATRLVINPQSKVAELLGSTREVTISDTSPIGFAIAGNQVTSVYFDGYLYSIICS